MSGRASRHVKHYLTAAAAALLLSACGEDAASPELVSMGQEAFAVCGTCHSVRAGAPHSIGPNLYGVYGRQAGQAEGYGYSPAMASSGIVWRKNALDAYIANPSGVVSGTTMIYEGEGDARSREAIIAYLQTLQ